MIHDYHHLLFIWLVLHSLEPGLLVQQHTLYLQTAVTHNHWSRVTLDTDHHYHHHLHSDSYFLSFSFTYSAKNLWEQVAKFLRSGRPSPTSEN